MEKDSKGLQRIQEYYDACFQFGVYLGGLERSGLNPRTIGIRKDRIAKEIELCGDNSIFTVFDNTYLEGYPRITQTLNRLLRIGINTKDELLELDADRAVKRVNGFGPAMGEVLKQLQRILQAEKNLTP